MTQDLQQLKTTIQNVTAEIQVKLLILYAIPSY